MMFQQIENLINAYEVETEAALDLADLTIKHGLQSFRYQSSNFLEAIFENLDIQKNTVFYDLGSGYGKVLLYGAVNFPDAIFKGIEILPERNNVCRLLIKNLALKNMQVSNADILSTDLHDGDVFYIFNPLYNFQYKQLLSQLQAVSKNKPIKIIAESRCDIFDEQPWLKVYEIIDIDVVRKIKFYTSY